MNSKKGFTLIELLAVIVILAILVLLAMPAVTNIMESSARTTFKNEMLSAAKIMETAYTEKWGNGDVTQDEGHDTKIHTVIQDGKTYSYLCMSLRELTEEQYMKKNLGNDYGGYLEMYVGDDETKTYLNTTNGKYYMQGYTSELSKNSYEPPKTNNGTEVTNETECPGVTVTPSDPEPDPSDTAYFNTGTTVNIKMKELANNTTSEVYSYSGNLTVTSFTKSSTILDTYKTDSHKVSTNESPNPIYMWYDSGTLYWYSDATNVYLNSDCSYMFHAFYNLANLNLSDLDASKVTNMTGMFSYLQSLTNLNFGSKFDTSNVTTMEKLFTHCTGLLTLDINLDTSSVTNMHEMFYWMQGLTSLTFGSKFDTSKVTDMGYMFSGCHYLTSLDLSVFNTDKVTDMSGMFSECIMLTSLNISSFNTENVTDMHEMFMDVMDLPILNVSHFKTGNVTNMNEMFLNAHSLTSLDLSSFNTSKVTDMGAMFFECAGLITLDISSFDTSKVTVVSPKLSTIINGMFEDCKNLKTVYVGNNWTTENISFSDEMFKNDTKLEGGAGTTFDTDHTDKEYARADSASTPGYFTLKTS